MNLNMVNPPRPAPRGRVIALPCSGADAGQWHYLAEALGGRYELFAPECPSKNLLNLMNRL
jgi:surfactin synthase thioesterase subunit